MHAATTKDITLIHQMDFEALPATYRPTLGKEQIGFMMEIDRQIGQSLRSDKGFCLVGKFALSSQKSKIMQNDIRFTPFTSPADKGWDEAWTIYENSFPYKEQRGLIDHMRALADPRFSACGIWLGDQLAGIFYYWRWKEDYYYCEHLAISPALRGQDLGSRALSAFCKQAKGVILEIDPPVDDISIRRLHFYRRVGFIESPQEYLHPSFRKPFETHKLVLMNYHKALTDIEVRDFADFVRDVVLNYSEHEHPTLP